MTQNSLFQTYFRFSFQIDLYIVEAFPEIQEERYFVWFD